MATLGELRKKLAQLKKEGASTQTKGRVQYQINQLLKKDKGKTIKTKTGHVKTKTGLVRQKDTGKKVKPNATVAKKKPAAKPSSKVTISAAPHANIKKVPRTKVPHFTNADLNNKMIPRIKGALPAESNRTKREHLEAARRNMSAFEKSVTKPTRKSKSKTRGM